MKFDLEKFKTFPRRPHIREGTLTITRHFEDEEVFEVISASIDSMRLVESFLGLVISNEYVSGGMASAIQRFKQYDIYSQLELSPASSAILQESINLFSPISWSLPCLEQISSALILFFDWDDKWLILQTSEAYYSLHWTTYA